MGGNLNFGLKIGKIGGGDFIFAGGTSIPYLNFATYMLKSFAAKFLSWTETLQCLYERMTIMHYHFRQKVIDIGANNILCAYFRQTMVADARRVREPFCCGGRFKVGQDLLLSF